MLSNSLNFSGGPGALPWSVLEQTHAAVLALPETGLSILGMSHRSAWFRDILAEAEQNLRTLLNVPDGYSVIFLQGGSSLQFSMIPMNFAAGSSVPAEFVISGYWSGKAVGEAATIAPARAIWDGASQHYSTLPVLADLPRSQHAPFFHYVSNETVEGLQFNEVPESLGVPLIADMSSDFLSRPVDVSRYSMIYAHAQKNLGPAGVTVALKDGWDPLDNGLQWEINSVGYVNGEGADYVLAILTYGSATESAGIAEVNGLARLVWAALAPSPAPSPAPSA